MSEFGQREAPPAVNSSVPVSPTHGAQRTSQPPQAIPRECPAPPPAEPAALAALAQGPDDDAHLLADFFSSPPPAAERVHHDEDEPLDERDVLRMSLGSKRAMWATVTIFGGSLLAIGGFIAYHQLVMPAPVELGGGSEGLSPLQPLAAKPETSISAALSAPLAPAPPAVAAGDADQNRYLLTAAANSLQPSAAPRLVLPNEMSPSALGETADQAAGPPSAAASTTVATASPGSTSPSGVSPGANPGNTLSVADGHVNPGTSPSGTNSGAAVSGRQPGAVGANPGASPQATHISNGANLGAAPSGANLDTSPNGATAAVSGANLPAAPNGATAAVSGANLAAAPGGPSPGAAVSGANLAAAPSGPGSGAAVSGANLAAAASGPSPAAAVSGAIPGSQRLVAPSTFAASTGTGAGLLVASTPQLPSAASAASPVLPVPVQPINIPGSPEPTFDELLSVARSFVKRGNNQTALEAFERALRVQPDAPAALSGKALTLLNMEDGRAAKLYASRAVAVDPTSSEGWIVLGAAEEQLGSRDAAREAYRRCAEQGVGSYVGECRQLAR